MLLSHWGIWGILTSLWTLLSLRDWDIIQHDEAPDDFWGLIFLPRQFRNPWYPHTSLNLVCLLLSYIFILFVHFKSHSKRHGQLESANEKVCRKHGQFPVTVIRKWQHTATSCGWLKMESGWIWTSEPWDLPVQPPVKVSYQHGSASLSCLIPSVLSKSRPDFVWHKPFWRARTTLWRWEKSTDQKWYVPVSGDQWHTCTHTVVFPSLQRSLHWLTFLSWRLILTLSINTTCLIIFS